MRSAALMVLAMGALACAAQPQPPSLPAAPQSSQPEAPKATPICSFEGLTAAADHPKVGHIREMGKKVYLFLNGNGDDRRIGGVFSTRAAAEDAIRFGDESSEVIEREVDAPQADGPPGRSLWQRYYSIVLLENTGYRVPAYEAHGEVDVVTINESGYAVLVWALDEDDAVEQSAVLFELFRLTQQA